MIVVDVIAAVACFVIGYKAGCSGLFNFRHDDPVRARSKRR